MKQYALIRVDVNDADYVQAFFPVNEKQIALLQKISTALKSIPDIPNWNQEKYYSGKDAHVLSDQLTKEEIERFEDLCPYCEGGFHTIVLIELFTVPENAINTIFYRS